MARVGRAVAFGAATIVNAIATGRGAAFGISLWTKARVELKEGLRTIEVKILPDAGENPRLAESVVKKVFERFKVDDMGARVETESNIPIARGLKSSSVAANAVALATLAALGEKLNDMDVVKLGVEAAIEAGVTITGAFDDACASYFGNVVVTNNLKMEVEKFFKPKEEYEVLIYVPEIKRYTSAVNVTKLREIAPLVDIAYEEALEGNYWRAMTLNGFFYSVALGFDPKVALEALARGAVAAGLSGKGPSFVAVAPKERLKEIVEVWKKRPGRLIFSKINREKARVVDEP